MQKNTKNKDVAAAYLRVSTLDQTNGISLDYQEQQCRNAAKQDGFTEVIVIREEGITGTSLKKRKAIHEIIDLIKKKEISILYVTHSDRLDRSTYDHAYLRQTLRENNVALKYLNGQSSGNDAASIVADNVFAAMNQYHSDNTREKTVQATDMKAKAGYLPTHAPVGYVNCNNPDPSCEKVAKRIIIPNPKTATLVTEAFQKYSTGQYNVYELNDLMFEKGLISNSGKKMSPSMVSVMLRNRIYLGEIHWKDIHVINGKHQFLIDEKTFNAVQKVIDGAIGGRCRRRKYFWLLNGFVFCPIHKFRYTAEWHLLKSKAYYHCTNKHGCGKYVEKTDLEKQVSDKFKNLQFSEWFVNSVIKKVKDIFTERQNTYYSKQRGLLNQKKCMGS